MMKVIFWAEGGKVNDSLEKNPKNEEKQLPRHENRREQRRIRVLGQPAHSLPHQPLQQWSGEAAEVAAHKSGTGILL